MATFYFVSFVPMFMKHPFPIIHQLCDFIQVFEPPQAPVYLKNAYVVPVKTEDSACGKHSTK